MKNMDTVKYNVLDRISVDINIEKNRFDIPLDKLLVMAARINPKRSFLFVSKVLGKHVPIKPKDGLIIGGLLGALYDEGVNGSEDGLVDDMIELYKRDKVSADELFPNVFGRARLDEKTLFVGFAETATALGHSSFSFFADNAYYIHTTREDVSDIEKIISFEEEHSHATSHRVYSQEEDILKEDNPVVLVDDEITTGKTLLNIIEALHLKHPRSKYSVLTILDWRNEESIQRFKDLEKKLGASIDVYSIVKGNINIDDSRLKENPLKGELTTREKNQECGVEVIDVSSLYALEAMDNGYLSCTGRFGMDSETNEELIDLVMLTGNHLNTVIDDKKTLCIGTEEFMFIPMAISSVLDGDVLFQSSTRSPIYPKDVEGYGAVTGDEISSLYNDEVKNFIYNIKSCQYEQAVVYMEKGYKENDKLVEQLKQMGFKKLFVVSFI